MNVTKLLVSQIEKFKLYSYRPSCFFVFASAPVGVTTGLGGRIGTLKNIEIMVLLDENGLTKAE